MADEFAENRYKAADSNRRFEIELLWKRATFFWGFLTAAFAAYFLLLKQSDELALLVSCFGVVASFVWLQANRASSFWQKVWEQNMMRDEAAILGKDVYDKVPHESELGDSPHFIGWQRVSLSGLTTGLSLYTLALWVFLLLLPAYQLLDKVLDRAAGPKEVATILFLAFTIGFLLYLYISCRKHPSIPSRPRATVDSSKLPSA